MTFNFRKILMVPVLAAGLCVAGAAQADIKIGASAPKTGPLASGAAITYWPILQYWKESVNARGGLKLKDGVQKVEIVEYDDRTNPQEALKNYERLINQDKADLLIAPFATAFNLAVAPIFAKNGYPQLLATAVTDKTPQLAKRYSNMFFLLGDSTEAVITVGKLLAKMKSEGKIGSKIAMVNVADAFGIESANIARTAFKEAGFDLVYDKSYPLGTQDLAPVVKGAKAANPDVFLAWSYPPDTFALTEQARIEQLGVKAFFLAVGTAYPGYAGRFGGFAEGTMGLGGVNADDGAMKAFFEGVKKATGKEPDYGASSMLYASLQAMEQAIEAVGEMDRAKITEHLKTKTFKTVIGELKFDNQVSGNFWTVGQWQNGKFHGVAPMDKSGAKPAQAKTNWN